MTFSSSRGPEEILPALAARVAQVRAIGPYAWKLELDQEHRPVTARAQGGWLHLEAMTTPSAVNGSAGVLLRRNGALSPGVKLVLPPAEHGVRVRAELPLDRSIDLGRALDAAVRGFGEAVADAASSAPTQTDDASWRGGDENDLAEVVRESLWPCPDGARIPFYVELDTPHAATARVERRGPRGPAAVSVDLELTGEASTASRRAVELLLLRASATVRLARAAIAAGPGGLEARFEVVFSGIPSAAEMDHALAALSVAWRGAAREARALYRDEAVARHYLALGDPEFATAERPFATPIPPARCWRPSPRQGEMR